MKTLKTYEIWKMIDEDFEKIKGKKFKLIASNNSIKYFIPGDIAEIGASSISKGLFSEDIFGLSWLLEGLTGFEEWEEVQKPATFMEAFNAWHDDNKTIRHENEYEGEVIMTTKFDGKNEFAEFGAGIIASGKWYIED